MYRRSRSIQRAYIAAAGQLEGGSPIAGLAGCRVKGQVSRAGRRGFPKPKNGRTFPDKQPKRPLFKRGPSLTGARTTSNTLEI